MHEAFNHLKEKKCLCACQLQLLAETIKLS